jgi:hypothetical protein
MGRVYGGARGRGEPPPPPATYIEKNLWLVLGFRVGPNREMSGEGV